MYIFGLNNEIRVERSAMEVEGKGGYGPKVDNRDKKVSRALQKDNVF